MQSYRYLLTSAKKSLLGRGFECPSCGHNGARVLDRKWLVTSLRRCKQCRLLFRTPTTTAAENDSFYQSDYTEGFTTDLPTPDALAAYKATNFAGTEKDYSHYLAVLAAVGVPAGARVYDFGCSWGYGSAQFRTAGFHTDSYEISAPRGAYAREQLGVTMVPPDEAAPGSYDVFFSAHVMEHVPSVADMIATGFRLLKPGGLFVTFTPNGGDDRRASAPANWHRVWGLVHPQVIDREYVEHRFRGMAYVVGSDPLPLDRLRAFPAAAPLVLPTVGYELFFAVRKPAA